MVWFFFIYFKFDFKYNDLQYYIFTMAAISCLAWIPNWGLHAPAHFPRFPLYPGDACLAPLQLLLDSEQLILILLLISAPVPDLSLEFFGEFFISCLVSLYPTLLDMVLVQVLRQSPFIHSTRSARYDAWSPYLTCSRRSRRAARMAWLYMLESAVTLPVVFPIDNLSHGKLY